MFTAFSCPTHNIDNVEDRTCYVALSETEMQLFKWPLDIYLALHEFKHYPNNISDFYVFPSSLTLDP